MEANMITPAYSTTATERVLPRMALDFTTGVLDPRVTVTRALNTATRVNSSGLVEIVNANLPRFDYNPTTLAPKGLLIEEARTNLVLNSVFSGAVSGTPGTPPTSWLLSFALGTLTVASLGYGFAANSLRFAATSNRQAMTQSITLAALSTYTITMSVIVHTTAQLLQFLQFNPVPVGATIQYVYNGVNQASSFQPPLGAGTLQAIVTTAAVGGSLGLRVGVGASSNITADITIWNIQLELGAFATSYIPTTTSSLTRNADAVSMTGTNFSSWYNATEGAFGFEFTPDLFLTSNINRVATISQGGATGRVVDIFTSGGNWNSYNGTTTIMSGASVVTSVKQRIVATYKTGSYALALNGVAPATAASALVNVANQIAIGSLGGSNYLNGHIQRISYWPQRITNAETQAFSKQ